MRESDIHHQIFPPENVYAFSEHGNAIKKRDGDTVGDPDPGRTIEEEPRQFGNFSTQQNAADQPSAECKENLDGQGAGQKRQKLKIGMGQNDHRGQNEAQPVKQRIAVELMDFGVF